MATTTALGSGSTNNNGGTALGAGSTGTALSNLALGSPLVNNSYVYDGTDTDEAYSAGAFAYNTSRPTAQGLPLSLGGVNSDVLLGAAGVPSLTQGVHRIEAITTTRVATAIRAGYWDVFAGAWSTAPTTAVDTYHKSISGSDSIDYAVRSHKVTYLVGSVPTTSVL